jgi:hypothetical protein
MDFIFRQIANRVSRFPRPFEIFYRHIDIKLYKVVRETFIYRLLRRGNKQLKLVEIRVNIPDEKANGFLRLYG